jgi:hypothetical protein
MRKCNKKIHHNLHLHHLKRTTTTMKRKRKKRMKWKLHDPSKS